ncbi:MYND finger domain-containing protein [Hirsutella rhossiliensis]|uniref:MYND finger domain-containing protein n=1 Tax=Hirsutella rhossiliensis TaxID=111463 RepID=A0A9P8MU51_9HYPO|nr:MYND finger domain-containing protein [Hirsutella rhossiliensis]KAH0960266.1 MYND finger domain-containing protein [Hirsutella rhossiliensis]
MTVDEPAAIPLTRPSCSARDANGVPCLKVPLIACPRCLLVAYCDAACRERHWDVHRPDCTRDFAVKCNEASAADMDDEDDDLIAAESTSFWCKYPATDVLNLDKNEGRYYDDRLDLLFTGESGVRHFIYSVVKLPETASPKLHVAINEASNLHVARTFFALSLLTARDRDPVVNAEACIHMWYSARMPRVLRDHVQSVVRENLGGTLEDMATISAATGVSPTRPCRLTWSLANLSVEVELRQSQWAAIRNHLVPCKSLGLAQSLILRYVDTRRRAESPCRFLARMTRSRALGLMKWHDDGILLPYGHPRDAFNTLNPIFFQGSEKYPAGASAEPLSEWPMELLDYRVSPAVNDVYGKMFYYLRDLLVEFQRRLAKTSLNLQLSCEATAELTDWTPALQFERPFDRIEVGHHWDVHPFLTLVAFSNLLRHEDENPFATLLTITRDSVMHGMPCLGANLQSERQHLYRPYNAVLDELAPPAAAGDKADVRDVVRRRLGLLMWRNWDKFASRYLLFPGHFAFASLIDPRAVDEHRSVVQAGFLGLAAREKHLITRRWPNRLVHSKKDKPSLRDFNRWLGWPSTVPLRWLEWKRCGDVSNQEWDSWMRDKSDGGSESGGEAEGQGDGGADEAGGAMKGKGKKKKQKRGKKSKGKKK